MKTILLTALLFIYSVAGFSVTWTITNIGLQFSPDTLTINSGDSVKFKLDSLDGVVEVSHTTWNLNGTIGITGGFSVPDGGGLVLPDKLGVGVHYYICQAHASSGMKGIIIVKYSSAQIHFQKDYGTADSLSDAFGSCVQQTFDGGYITTGYISNFGASSDDIYLVKTNSTGDTLWTKTYGGTGADDANYVIQTSDSGYAITGVTTSFGGKNMFLIKISETGIIRWSKIYGTGDSSSDAFASAVQQTSDGGYILTGYISNYGAGMDDFYLVKTDVRGTPLWTKTYGGTKNDDANSVEQTADGGYIIAGTTSSFGDTLGDIYLVKTNSAGDTLWTKSYGSNLTDAADMGNSVRQTSDHGYIIAGVTISTSAGEFARLIKTDSTGAIQWTKLFGTNNTTSDASFACVQKTTDGGYISAGYISNFGAGSDDYYLVKTKANGDTLWTRTYGSKKNDDAYFVKETSDGGYIVAGLTLGFAAGGGHLYLAKADTIGNSSCNVYYTQTTLNTSIGTKTSSTPTRVSTGGVATNAAMIVMSGGLAKEVCETSGIYEKPIGKNQIKVFPNPSSSEVTFASGTEVKNALLKIYDVNGKEVKEINFSGMQVTLEKGNLETGIYFYQVLSGSEIIGSGKLILE